MKKSKKPIFVSYVYYRRVYNNPSMEQFDKLPAREQERLWERLEKKGIKTPLGIVHRMQAVSKRVH